MIRVALTALAAAGLLGAAKVPTVDYRLGVTPQATGSPLVEVEMAFRGDADGETRLELPDHWASAKDVWRYVSDLEVTGAEVTQDGPAVRRLRHRPNAKITVRYRVQTAYDADPDGASGNAYKGPLIRPDWMALIGEFVFAAPEGRNAAPATFRWGRLPKGWRVASDLEHGRMGRPMTVGDVAQSITVGGPRLTLVERPITGGTLRFAAPNGAPFDIEPFADDVAGIVSGQRAYWNDLNEPYFVAYLPLTPRPSGSSSGGTGRGDAFVLYGTPNADPQRMRWTIAHEHIHSWMPNRVARRYLDPEAASYWIGEGFTEFLTARTLARAGLVTPEQAVAYWNEQLKLYDANPLKTATNAKVVSDFWSDRNAQRLPYQRGMLLALKWDEDIRRKTGGKADLDDVVLRMRDHNLQFPANQGPDIVTGLVSAAWVVAGIDLRPDIAKYAERGEAIPLPEQFFDGCVDTRVTVTPAFDAGFDVTASMTDKVAKGVRRNGPAWNSGLRDGMRFTAMDLKAGDANREVVLGVLPANGRGKSRTIRFWPYGDKDIEARALALAYGLEGEKLAACGRKIGGL